MNWQERAGRGGVCDFKQNYDFYFKWLCNKVMSCFVIKDRSNGKTETINWNFFKMNLLLDGQICVTDFTDKLYACIGNRGGEPNEYYLPQIFTIANPILGSKQVKIGKDGVVFYNTDVDAFSYTGNNEIFSGGLYDLISQTATLLADNIISINCAQINSRITTFFTAESDSQAIAGEGILKKMYAGKPYQILRSDLIEKLNVNPVNTSATGNITELVELHNYIAANFFQSIGVKSNNVMKRERLINSEIDSQNDYLKISILEILSSWQKGFDELNKIYGTDIEVTLNPALLDEIVEDSTSDEMVNGTTSVEDVTDSNNDDENVSRETTDETTENNDINEPSESPESIINDIEEKQEVVEEIVDIINDNVENNDEEDSQYNDTTDDSETEISNEINKESEEKSNVEEEGEEDEPERKDDESDTD
jgi:hypothetical protein